MYNPMAVSAAVNIPITLWFLHTRLKGCKQYTSINTAL